MSHVHDSAAARASRVDPAPALVVPHPGLDALARGWLWLGLLALAGSGVFAVLLVLSRTPLLNQWLPVADFFRVALIVHVNLSVLVWFVALAGLLWSISGSARAPWPGWLALRLCSVGTVLMALAPFTGRAQPIMSNYIPVLDGPVFVAGLAVFGPGGAALVLRGLIAIRPMGPGLAEGRCTAVRLQRQRGGGRRGRAGFRRSLLLVPRSLDPQTYYEILFWGGGHALQFVWTLLMLVGWLWLAGASGACISLSPRLTRCCSRWPWSACSSRPTPTWPAASHRWNSGTSIPGRCAWEAAWPSCRLAWR